MPTFEYEALDATGQSKRSQIEADSPQEARQKLRQSGLYISEIIRCPEAPPSTPDRKSVPESPTAHAGTHAKALSGWLIGIPALLMCGGTALWSPFVALCFLILALLMLPPVRAFAFGLTDRGIESKTRRILVCSLLGVIGILSVYQSVADKLSEKDAAAARERDAMAARFFEQKAELLEKWRSMLAEGLHTAAIYDAEVYARYCQDPDLGKFIEEAKAAARLVKKEKEIAQVLSEVASLPEEDFERRATLYKRLVSLEPSNSHHRDQLAHYSSLAAETKSDTVRLSDTQAESSRSPRYEAINSAPSADTTVYITKTGAKYHTATCRTLRASKTAATVSKAEAKGLTPCRICNP